MDYQELVSAVATKTGRPDQGDLISLEIREATKWAHLFDFWRRDLSEIPLTYDPPLFTGQILVDTYLPGFRKISYIRKYDPLLGNVGDFLKPVEPDSLFDSFNCRKTDIFYLGGKVLNWFSSTSDSGHIVGYWKMPSIVASSYDSWIAKDHEFIIVNYASAKVFDSIGQEAAAKKHFSYATAMLAALQTNEIETVGR